MNEKELIRAVMEVFKNNDCNVGDVLQPQLILNFKMKLSTQEQELLSTVEHHLESIDYFSIEGTAGKVSYRLKQNGYDYICNDL